MGTHASTIAAAVRNLTDHSTSKGTAELVMYLSINTSTDLPKKKKRYRRTHNKHLECCFEPNGGCQIRFSTEKGRKRHRETVHEKKRPYVCYICVGEGAKRRGYLAARDLRSHPKQVHRSESRQSTTRSRQSTTIFRRAGAAQHVGRWGGRIKLFSRIDCTPRIRVFMSVDFLTFS